VSLLGAVAVAFGAATDTDWDDIVGIATGVGGLVCVVAWTVAAVGVGTASATIGGGGVGADGTGDNAASFTVIPIDVSLVRTAAVVFGAATDTDWVDVAGIATSVGTRLIGRDVTDVIDVGRPSMTGIAEADKTRPSTVFCQLRARMVRSAVFTKPS
jgi:hypothetical protein